MRLMSGLLAASLCLASGTASAASVMVWGEDLQGGSYLNTINSFYDGLPDTSSTITAGTLDTVDLSGVGLLWALQPADAYTAAELSAMSGYLATGGRIAFMGEHGTFAPAQNTRINAALAAVGSTISINNTVLDGGFQSASVADGQILAHTLTQGVNSYQYAAFAPLVISGSAQALMLGADLTSVMMAYQNIGPGSVFLITDQNVWDNAPVWGGAFDNGRMFANLLQADTGAPPPPGVPEPATMTLLAVGLIGGVVARRQLRA